ncbi:MAG: hypothetical protein ABIO70_34150 [Pseudomonadota bacterium]
MPPLTTETSAGRTLIETALVCTYILFDLRDALRDHLNARLVEVASSADARESWRTAVRSKSLAGFREGELLAILDDADFRWRMLSEADFALQLLCNMADVLCPPPDRPKIRALKKAAGKLKEARNKWAHTTDELRDRVTPIIELSGRIRALLGLPAENPVAGCRREDPLEGGTSTYGGVLERVAAAIGRSDGHRESICRAVFRAHLATTGQLTDDFVEYLADDQSIPTARARGIAREILSSEVPGVVPMAQVFDHDSILRNALALTADEISADDIDVLRRYLKPHPMHLDTLHFAHFWREECIIEDERTTYRTSLICENRDPFPSQYVRDSASLEPALEEEIKGHGFEVFPAASGEFAWLSRDEVAMVAEAQRSGAAAEAICAGLAARAAPVATSLIPTPDEKGEAIALDYTLDVRFPRAVQMGEGFFASWEYRWNVPDVLGDDYVFYTLRDRPRGVACFHFTLQSRIPIDRCVGRALQSGTWRSLGSATISQTSDCWRADMVVTDAAEIALFTFSRGVEGR